MPKMPDATYGERMCWSHNAFMSHPATVSKMSDATLARLIRPTGSASGNGVQMQHALSVLDFTR